MTALRKVLGYGARELQVKPDKVTFEENCLYMDILGVAFRQRDSKTRFWGRSMLSLLRRNNNKKASVFGGGTSERQMGLCRPGKDFGISCVCRMGSPLEDFE